jgi:hypothetical protein
MVKKAFHYKNYRLLTRVIGPEHVSKTLRAATAPLRHPGSEH